MRGYGLETTGVIFAGSRWRIFRVAHEAEASRSFAAVNWYYSDRFLGQGVGAGKSLCGRPRGILRRCGLASHY